MLVPLNQADHKTHPGYGGIAGNQDTPGSEMGVGSSHAWFLICRKCRAMALLSKNEIAQRTGHAAIDLAFIAKERVTLVSWPTRSNSQVSTNPVAKRDRGAENSCMCNRNR